MDDRRESFRLVFGVAIVAFYWGQRLTTDAWRGFGILLMTIWVIIQLYDANERRCRKYSNQRKEREGETEEH